TDAVALRRLADGLPAVAARLEPREAARVWGQAVAALTQVMRNATGGSDFSQPVQALVSLASQLEPKEAARVDRAIDTLFPAFCFTQVVGGSGGGCAGGTENLTAILCREATKTSRMRVAACAGIIAGMAGPAPFLPASACLQPTLFRVPTPLPAQTLVDLLKPLFCVDEARRAVLAQLSRHYHRPFADQWDFVRYVHEHHLNLDLTTPPKIR
ncbi:MAG TPA: hypothetical protein VFA18_05970, partial [Gemmataceae bacterium]|nr:hypothetical protein [Gemmataceae bacterium]